MGERTTRDEFIGRVRAALGRSSGRVESPAPPTVDDAVARVASSDDDTVERFARRAEATGMTVHRCTGATLAEAIGERLNELAPTSAVVAIGDAARRRAVEALLAERGIEVGAWRGDPEMTADYDAGVGITDVAGAIAEAGTLIYRADADHGKGPMLAPPVHLAIVRASQVIPDLLDEVRRLDAAGPEALPAAEVLVTGPSKTADIEGVLVTGVHGPGKVIVLLVTDA